MIDIAELLTVERIRCNAELGSKKRAFETLAEIIAADSGAQPEQNGDEQPIGEQQIFDALISRERLGSTGLGHGIALPHGRISQLQQPLAAVLTLHAGIDFDAPDGAPVNLLFGLVMPEDCNEQHLQILAGLAGMFSDEGLREDLRNCTEPAQLLEMIAAWQARSNAP